MNAKVKILDRAGASFPVRRMDFNFDQVPEYWMNNSAGLTHFMTALSALFPAGEKFFIDSVRAVRKHPTIKDNLELQKEISAFIGQEAMHTQEHIGFNAAAQKYGHDVETLDGYTDQVLTAVSKTLTWMGRPVGISKEMVDLTATTALEHFTATIATQLLSNQHIQALMTDETMKTMWLWHAIEENEHKAVAFDVFEGVFGRGLKAYALRTSSLIIAMSTLFIVQNYFLYRLLKQDKQLNMASLQIIYEYAYSLEKGVITGMGKEMLMYFKPGFHPNDLDTQPLLKKWKAKLGF